MRKAILAALVSASLLTGAGFAVAAPGPNGSNEHGLCTAFFNGQKKGHDKNGNPGPFAALLESAPDGSDEGDEGGSVADLYDHCQQFGIGGNGDENGRYTTCWTDDDGDADTHPCDD